MAEASQVEHEFWGRKFTFTGHDDGTVRLATDGYSAAIAMISATRPMQVGSMLDAAALDEACETYSLLSGIEPADEEDDGAPPPGPNR